MSLLDQLEIEHDNFRGALDWVLRVGDAGLGLRLTGALGWFWNRRTHWREGSDWLEKFLAVGGPTPVPVRAKATHHLLELSFEMGNKRRVASLYDEGVALARAVEDLWVKAWLLSSLGLVGFPLTEHLLTYLDEALVVFRSLGDLWGICETLNRLSGALSDLSENERADQMRQEGIRLARQANDKSVLCWMLAMAVSQNLAEGKIDAQTERINRESLILFQELGYKNGLRWALWQSGRISLFHHEEQQAKTYFEQCLMVGQQLDGTGSMVINSLIGLSEIFCSQGESERGIQLLGAVNDPIQARFTESFLPDRVVRMDFERALIIAHASVDETTFATDFAEGQRMTIEQAIAYALADTVGTPRQTIDRNSLSIF